MEEEDRPNEMIGVRRCRSRPGLFRLCPDYTSWFALLTEDSPKSSHGHFRLGHLICVCSFNSGYLLLLLFRPIYLFYVAVGEKFIIRKHPHVCFYFHAVVSINKWSSLSRASLKSYLIMRVKWGRHGRVLEQQLTLCIRFLSQLLLKKNPDTRQDGHFCIILCVFGHLSSTTN